MDLARLRAGEATTAQLEKFQSLVQRFQDAVGYLVYRALRIDAGSVTGAADLNEPSLSSWSLKPNRALMIANAGGTGPYQLFRDRVGTNEASLYLDEYEDEVIRGPLAGHTSLIAAGIVSLGPAAEMVYVNDVVRRGRDATGNGTRYAIRTLSEGS